jgi:hypothetical protein
MKTQDPMKPVGVWEVRRRIKIPTLVHAADAIEVEHVIGMLSGVYMVATDLEKHLITVLYDASQVDYQTILNALGNTRFAPMDNWWSQIKGSWYGFTDTNARDNAKAPPAACCNKPPK